MEMIIRRRLNFGSLEEEQALEVSREPLHVPELKKRG